MPVTSEATTTWTGSLAEGSGTVAFSSSKLGTFPIDWKARSEGSDTTTTPDPVPRVRATRAATSRRRVRSAREEPPYF